MKPKDINIYLDIDGVLLANTTNAAHGADHFLQYILKRWPDTTHWLTTHQWQNEDTTRLVLAPVLSRETLSLLERIKPTSWNNLKTEGINFSRPFLWFDDDVMPDEYQILEHHNCIDSLRHINLSRDPYQLQDELAYLKSLG